MVERKFEKACLISVQRNLEYALFLVVDNLFFQLRSKDYKALLKWAQFDLQNKHELIFEIQFRNFRYVIEKINKEWREKYLSMLV